VKILYIDCFSGVSGDMTIAALVDAGANKAYIEQELLKIDLEPYTLEWKTVVKCGITALKFDVTPSDTHPPIHHRHYSDIVDAINQAGFNENVTRMSLAIFKKIGIAEGKIHNIPLDKVHFHEVGAIDSIVDIVGTALALDSLHIEKVISAPVPLGSGTIECDHGLYPIPAPATLEMMKGIPIAPTPFHKEMTTPTGAAIISVMAEQFMKGLPTMIIESIGYGAGTRDLPRHPNVLRVVIGEVDDHSQQWQPPQLHTHDEHIHHEHVHEHNHGHDHEHGHSHDHSHTHTHSHSHEHEHSHNHEDGHDHDHSNSHEHTHEDVLMPNSQNDQTKHKH
jgi:uncharacterized protein (TIGR00299 family) protein